MSASVFRYALCGLLSLPSVSLGATMDIADLTTVDDLGYECIAGEYFEETEDTAAIAFVVSEKIRLPRTCLPEPCDRALTQRELSNLTGTEITLARFQDEWDDYYARYADFCRKETVDPAGPSPFPIQPYTFWDPFIENPNVIVASVPTGALTTTPVPGVVSPTATTSTPTIPGTPGTPITTTIFEDDDDGDDDDNGEEDGGVASTSPEEPIDPEDPTISPVPLPGGLVLLGSALIALRLRRST